jgi:hypothetical protein
MVKGETSQMTSSASPPMVVGVEPQAARNHSRSDIVNLLTPAE